jgi:hypothetical protein
MHKLVPVEDAKVLLNEGKNWGIWRWLTEKRRVRQTTDRGTEALDELEKTVKSTWSDDLTKAYAELVEAAALENGGPGSKRKYEKARKEAENIDPKIKAAAKRVKDADDEAYRARMDAERMFDEAERRLSAGMAREASQVAIDAYGLREKAIRKAEAAAWAK